MVSNTYNIAEDQQWVAPKSYASACGAQIVPAPTVAPAAAGIPTVQEGSLAGSEKQAEDIPHVDVELVPGRR
ncbi:hypothetical protein BESB_022480 [Besnoitia besnoiti]|uniref:Uncharacterized protein n=1 Tax=Besnoitia besnoiti TaxID=94643 RepID=A0A2A9M784_BESBE|nr:hypothetical protein BESB_022480 [Besnoitia besnoiti]PFH31756.1 hypothetical protein BESB_022480 [Besnoitia besnoiti]